MHAHIINSRKQVNTWFIAAQKEVRNIRSASGFAFFGLPEVMSLDDRHYEVADFRYGDGTPAEVSAAGFAEQNSRVATEHGVRESV